MSVDSVSSSSNTVHNAVSQAKSRINEAKTAAASKASKASEASSSSSSSSSTSSSGSSDAVEMSSSADSIHRSSVASLDDDCSGVAAESDDSSLSSGKVTISGSEASNNIDITIAEDGSYVVSVNGEETTYSPDEVESLNIKGGRGDDNISIHGSYTSDIALSIDAGAGNDSIVADDDVQQAMTIEGGKGDDYM